jgi:predicted nucleic acid-binding protein
MALVLDTGPLFASLDRTDRNHQVCAELLMTTQESLVIPAPVLVEMDYWIQQRMQAAVMTTLLERMLSGGYSVMELIRNDYARVHELMQVYSDARVGFVDAAVLAVVERLGERKLATLDRRHFSLMRPRHVAALELLPA